MPRRKLAAPVKRTKPRIPAATAKKPASRAKNRDGVRIAAVVGGDPMSRAQIKDYVEQALDKLNASGPLTDDDADDMIATVDDSGEDE